MKNQNQTGLKVFFLTKNKCRPQHMLSTILFMEGGVREVWKPQNRTKNAKKKNANRAKFYQSIETSITKQEHNRKINVSLDKMVNHIKC